MCIPASLASCVYSQLYLCVVSLLLYLSQCGEMRFALTPGRRRFLQVTASIFGPVAFLPSRERTYPRIMLSHGSGAMRACNVPGGLYSTAGLIGPKAESDRQSGEVRKLHNAQCPKILTLRGKPG